MDPVLSGGAIAIFAFALATGRDAWKDRRKRRRHESAVLAAIRDELAANRATLENNTQLLSTELVALRSDDRIVNPLDPLEAGFWDLVKLDPPLTLDRTPGALSAVRDVARRTGQVNEMLRSRELYRSASGAAAAKARAAGEMIGDTTISSINEALEGYDKLILQFGEELLEAISDLEPLLDPPRHPRFLRGPKRALRQGSWTRSWAEASHRPNG